MSLKNTSSSKERNFYSHILYPKYSLQQFCSYLRYSKKKKNTIFNFQEREKLFHLYDPMPNRDLHQLKLTFEKNRKMKLVMKDEYRRSFIAYLPNILTSKTMYLWWKISFKAIKWKKPECSTVKLFRSATFFVIKNCRCKR